MFNYSWIIHGGNSQSVKSRRIEVITIRDNMRTAHGSSLIDAFTNHDGMHGDEDFHE